MTFLITDPYTLLPKNQRVFTGGFRTIPPVQNEMNIDIEHPCYDVDILLPYQIKLVADESSLMIVEKSRRIGASFVIALKCVLASAAENGGHSIYASYNFEMTRTFIHDCKQFAIALQVASSEIEEFLYEDEDKDILAYRITFNSGFSIQALSSRPVNFRSKSAALIVLDEFAFIKSKPEEILKACIALQIWGAKIVILSTHNGIGSLFNQLVEQVRSGNRKGSLHRITFDDALKDGLYKRICLMTGQYWSQELEDAWREEIIAQYYPYADEELFAIPSRSTDILFNDEAVKRNAIGKWKDPKKSRYYLAGIDPNFGGMDNYVLLIFDITQLPIQIVHSYSANYQSTLKSRKDSIDIIKKYNPHLISIEKNSGGAVIAEELIRLMPNRQIETVNTTKMNKVVNTDRVASLVETDELIFPNDWKGIAEMGNFSKKLREAVAGHDDHVMAAAMGLANLQEALENLPRRSRPVSGDNRIQNLF